MCGVLGIERSSYYKWLNRRETANEIENHQIAQWIIDYDDRFNHILGYRRMTLWINRLNHKNYHYKRIRRVMRLLGIHAVIRRKKSKYLRVVPEIITENILNRNFYADKPNEKWVADVTEFKDKHSQKKLYLSAILDLYDRSIVAFEISDHNNNHLVFKTFEKAMTLNPGATPLFHSDRGLQYTSRLFRHKLETYGIEQSMSRVSRCIDNGPIEGFWGIVKSEMYIHHKYESIKELRQAIHKYIDFYNYQRFQSRFNNQTPMEVRESALIGTNIHQYPMAENKRIKKYYEAIKLKQQIPV